MMDWFMMFTAFLAASMMMGIIAMVVVTRKWYIKWTMKVSMRITDEILKTDKIAGL